MPIVIECIVTAEHLKDLLDELNTILDGGAIFTTPIDLIMAFWTCYFPSCS